VLTRQRQGRGVDRSRSRRGGRQEDPGGTAQETKQEPAPSRTIVKQEPALRDLRSDPHVNESESSYHFRLLEEARSGYPDAARSLEFPCSNHLIIT